jgi:predicted TPR repeat methyltransferase
MSYEQLLEQHPETAAPWVLRGIRNAALTYAEDAAPDDEFLGWFLGVTRGRMESQLGPRRLAFDADAPLVNLPKLPDADAVRRGIAQWSLADPKLGANLASGIPAGKALARWGAGQIQAGQLATAASAFLAVAALAPLDADAWSNCGVVFDLSNSLPQAAACLEHSLALSGLQPDTWLQLGLVRKKLGDLLSAEASYRAALELEPANALAWQCLGLLREEQADFAGAIDCLAACLEHGGAQPAISGNLGKLCYRIGRLVEAHQAYAEAAKGEPANLGFRKMERQLGFIRTVLEGRSVEAAIAAFWSSFATRDAAAEREFRDAFDAAFGVLSGFGHGEAARRVGRRHIEVWPGEPSMDYLLTALEGRGADRSPSAYIVDHFDRFAESFDAKLVGTLRYDIPEQIQRAVEAIPGSRRFADALDAGCGTGLCGPLIRSASQRLVGVDLSSKMLEQASKRRVYDSLVCEDVLTYLARSARAFDLIVAADVVVYFGELGKLLASAALATRSGGWLVFSTESQAEDGFKLKPTGRFAHAANYVCRMASPEFILHACTTTTIRLEGTNRVPGNLFVFRRL